MMEIKITSRTCPDDLGRPRTFHYSLTVDTVEAGAVSWENYGVRVWEEAAVFFAPDLAPPDVFPAPAPPAREAPERADAFFRLSLAMKSPFLAAFGEAAGLNPPRRPVYGAVMVRSL